jgi:hypothetical protein
MLHTEDTSAGIRRKGKHTGKEVIRKPKPSAARTRDAFLAQPVAVEGIITSSEASHEHAAAARRGSSRLAGLHTQASIVKLKHAHVPLSNHDTRH